MLILLTAHLKHTCITTDSIEVAKITIGIGGIAVTGIKASGTAALLIGGGVAAGFILVAGGIVYGVIKSMEKEKKS